MFKCIHFSFNNSVTLYALCAAEGRIRESIDIRELMSTSKKDINDLLDVPARSAILKTITVVKILPKYITCYTKCCNCHALLVMLIQYNFLLRIKWLCWMKILLLLLPISRKLYLYRKEFCTKVQSIYNSTFKLKKNHSNFAKNSVVYRKCVTFETSYIC